MRKTHQSQKKPAQPKSETNGQATQKKINIINRKQIPPIQSSAHTHLDLGIQLWRTASNSKTEILPRFQRL
jgi:hypothetical protein